MARFGFVGFLLTIGCLVAAAGEPSKSVNAKKLAEAVAQAMIRGDYAKVIDLTYDKLVKELGGREAAIKATEAAMKEMANRGVTMKSYRVGEPSEIMTEGTNTFVVVPTTMEIKIPAGTAISRDYLLGISTDGGRSWRFADGSQLHTKQQRERWLPKLPPNLKLPEKQKVEIIKDKQ
jgi:hypothetical protein